MRYDTTLIRFMLLTAQDQDRGLGQGADFVKELSHWFARELIQMHQRMLCETGMLRDQDQPRAGLRPRLTRVGAMLATRLRDDNAWRDVMPPHHPPDARTIRGVFAQALRRIRSQGPGQVAAASR